MKVRILLVVGVVLLLVSLFSVVEAVQKPITEVYWDVDDQVMSLYVWVEEEEEIPDFFLHSINGGGSSMSQDWQQGQYFYSQTVELEVWVDRIEVSQPVDWHTSSDGWGEWSPTSDRVLQRGLERDVSVSWRVPRIADPNEGVFWVSVYNNSNRRLPYIASIDFPDNWTVFSDCWYADYCSISPSKEWEVWDELPPNSHECYMFVVTNVEAGEFDLLASLNLPPAYGDSGDEAATTIKFGYVYYMPLVFN